MANLKRFWMVSLACGSLLLHGEAAAQSATGAQGAKGPKPAPAAGGGGNYDISSDSLVRYETEHRAVYSGAVQVVIDGGRARIDCDTLNVYFYGPGEGPNATAPKPAPGAASSETSSDSVKQMVADGHVYYVTQNETVHGDRGVYDLEPDIVTLTGGVIVVQGKDVLRTDKLVMNQKSGETLASSNATGRNNPNRVRSVIYNDNGQASPSQAGQASQGQVSGKAPAAPAKKP